MRSRALTLRTEDLVISLCVPLLLGYLTVRSVVQQPHELGRRRERIGIGRSDATAIDTKSVTRAGIYQIASWVILNETRGKTATLGYVVVVNNYILQGVRQAVGSISTILALLHDAVLAVRERVVVNLNRRRIGNNDAATPPGARASGVDTIIRDRVVVNRCAIADLVNDARTAIVRQLVEANVYIRILDVSPKTRTIVIMGVIICNGQARYLDKLGATRPCVGVSDRVVKRYLIVGYRYVVPSPTYAQLPVVM